ncbi:MAG: PatB family C-S lyase [Bacteroidaceae bacterium]|nr:PatB family C-S lyase [Bacteroidaceae bacterium]
MIYDFDKPVDRSGSGDFKHAVLQERFGRSDLLPLWVADMDWETPPFVTNALRQRLEHSLYGYTKDPADYWPTVQRWIEDHHQWRVERDWLTYIPGIVKGIGMVINFFLKEDTKVIVQPPIYHPFFLTPKGNKREVVWNPLKEVRDRQGNLLTYEMDFEGLEQICWSVSPSSPSSPSMLSAPSALLILSNPHNPAGIVWDKATLQRLAHIAKEHNILVISDEIHADMVLYGHKHIPFASVSDEAAEVSITFGAPTKTFNMAGIVSSWSIIPNPQLRRPFYAWLDANEFSETHLFAPIATIAALQQGEEWRQQMLRYVEGNIDFLIDYCQTHIPQIKPFRPQASFLVWLDCRGLGLNHHQLVDFFVNQARLALNDGEMFGPGGEGFMRINVGTQRNVLKEALERIEGVSV